MFWTAVLIVVVLIIVAAVIYWLFVIAEGAYLGPKTVVLLYDWSAKSYDRIKDVSPIDEAERLALPLLSQLNGATYPLVLDVATGTGRLPLALLRQPDFAGRVIGTDLSARMLAEAYRKAAWFRSQVDFVRQPADQLAFADETFDAVTCLEALEFMPNPRKAIAEMVRVLKPGGILLVSNRVGWEARFLPGRCCGRGRMEKILATHPLRGIRTQLWQVHYDLIWARKGNGAKR